jgi:predicted nucleotidyltransferase
LSEAKGKRWYRGTEVPRHLIQRFADEVADRFGPEKIVLFGSHACSEVHADSDVDILVIMPARNELDQALRIRLAVDYQFPLDLLVRTPQTLARRLSEGDSFLKEVMQKGKILFMKRLTAEWKRVRVIHRMGALWTIRTCGAKYRLKWSGLMKISSNWRPLSLPVPGVAEPVPTQLRMISLHFRIFSIASPSVRPSLLNSPLEQTMESDC